MRKQKFPEKLTFPTQMLVFRMIPSQKIDDMETSKAKLMNDNLSGVC